MTNINEIHLAAIRVINNTLTLSANVANGCVADKADLEKGLLRVAAIKEWAIANNKIQDLRSYFASKNWAHLKFEASKMATFFNN